MNVLAKSTIGYEQAVYGSFPFWDRGYAVLAQSPGCRPEWLNDLRSACQRYGEQPSSTVKVGGLFVLRLADGTWMIVGPSAQGPDNLGRPGALAFHALFLSEEEYRRADYTPFGLAGGFRVCWSADLRALARGHCTVSRPTPLLLSMDPRVDRIVAALTRGRRVALEAAGPIDELAGLVWRALPCRLRKRLTFATWAFGNGNRFDFVALPRLGSTELDASYVDPASIAGASVSRR